MPIKLMAASRRRPGLTRAEYQRYLEFYHGTIARQQRLKISSYVQNHVIDGAFGTLADETTPAGRRARCCTAPEPYQSELPLGARAPPQQSSLI